MNQTILSTKQSKLLEDLIVKHGRLVTYDQILKEAEGSWDYPQTKNLITEMVKDGWLFRIKRELYAISDLTTRGYLSLSPYVVANLLLPDSYVSFELALQHYGMFDQMTSKVISVSLKRHKSVVVSGTTYTYITTKPQYYFGWQDVHFENQIAKIATAEKAIIDMVKFHKSQYSIDLVIEKLKEYKSELDFDKLSSDYYSICWKLTPKNCMHSLITAQERIGCLPGTKNSIRNGAYIIGNILINIRQYDTSHNYSPAIRDYQSKNAKVSPTDC
jgi:predicted transcriptional regulator of viral defense system